MPWPWEYDPVNSDGGGPVTASDRRRMALKYVVGIAGFAYFAAAMNSKGLTHAVSMGVAVALGAAAIIDLLWLARGDYNHVILRDRGQARVLAWAFLVVALASGVTGIVTA
jgi:hypothetical protein